MTKDTIKQPWGSYTKTSDSFFIPPNREDKYIQFCGRFQRNNSEEMPGINPQTFSLIFSEDFGEQQKVLQAPVKNISSEEFKWELPAKHVERSVEDGDLRIITADVQGVFEASKIVTDWDEDGNTLEEVDGFIIRIPAQTIVYTGQPSQFIGHTIKEK